MKTILDDGYVFFNHFIRATEEITLETLTLAWRRGAGIIAPTGWKGGNLVIPIAIPKLNAMSFIMVQVKNRGNSSMTDRLKNEALSALDSAASNLGISRPFVDVAPRQAGQGDDRNNTLPSCAFNADQADRKADGDRPVGLED